MNAVRRACRIATKGHCTVAREETENLDTEAGSGIEPLKVVLGEMGQRARRAIYGSWLF